MEMFRAADVIACEDTRVTGKLLHLMGIKRPLLRHDDHADDRDRAALIARMGGEVIVLVSDAGTPLISDPGYRLVRDARAAGAHVSTVPGPSALVTALSIAGLPTDRFLFAGFLPPKAKARADAIAELTSIRATLVFYESGPRLPACLAALRAGLGDRDASVARELTKLHEECVTAPLSQLEARFAEPPRGEIVIIVAPPSDQPPQEATAESIDDALQTALADMPVAKAAKAVAQRLGITRDAAYARALELTGKK